RRMGGNIRCRLETTGSDSKKSLRWRLLCAMCVRVGGGRSIGMSSVIRVSIRAILVLFVCAAGLWAQSSRASLGGRVIDSQGGVVPGATVTVTSEETGVAQTTKTNEQGNWLVQFLLPARYKFAVSASGFKTTERTGITLQTSDSKQIDVQLE